MYYCPICGHWFPTPLILKGWENLDGENGWYERRDAFCPECRSQEFYQEDMGMNFQDF